MGGIASVYVRSPDAQSLQNEEAVNEEMDTHQNLEALDWSNTGGTEGVDDSGGGNPPNRLELRITSSLPVHDREAEMGRIIQYLAEENVTLRRKTFQLEADLENAKKTAAIPIQPDIYGETDEQKINRLEKTLVAEREEKWSNIEKCEQYRVDLVNCECRLSEEISRRENMSDELLSTKRQIEELQVIIERLKKSDRVSVEDDEESIDGRSFGSGTSSRRISRSEGDDMASFRAQLKEKREARQKAIAAKSLELNQMRTELQKEKALREKLERELDRLKRLHVENGSPEEVSLEKGNLLDEIEELRQEIQRMLSIKEENMKLVEEVKGLKHEIRELNTTILQQQNDLLEATRRQDRLVRDQAEIKDEKDRSQQRQKEIEEEQNKMWAEYDSEKLEIAKRTQALKDVIEISKQMLVIREKQVVDLKKKLKDIEESLAEKRNLEDGVLKVEYEKQLENIKMLKTLYEERLALMEAERKKLTDKISEDATTIEDLKSTLSDLTIKYDMACDELDTEKQGNISLTRELDEWVAQAHSYERELSVMNTLLTQMLVGPYGTDLDRLTDQLQQNHVLIAEMTTCDDCSDVASALPKLLLDLIAQVERSEPKQQACSYGTSGTKELTQDPMTDSTDTISEQSEGLLAENAGAVLPIVSYKNATVFKPPISPTLSEDNSKLSHIPTDGICLKEDNEDVDDTTPRCSNSPIDPSVQVIVSNLPKVWRVLTELLSHHSAPCGPTLGDERNCYKNVDTPNGPRSVISVSNTFLRLKDLILEKKSLQKEVYHLKHLNAHLMSRMDDQEKRLSQVRCELHKTWGIVGRMRAQHQQLHNQEKILRYELQEKRVMLTELKQELEYCREKWDRARRKNTESEVEWKKLRKEFAARKLADANLHDSGESGYSDEQNDSDETGRSTTPSPVDFINAAHVLETVASQPVAAIDVLVSSDQEVVLAYDTQGDPIADSTVCQEGGTVTVPERPPDTEECQTPVLNEGATAVHSEIPPPEQASENPEPDPPPTKSAATDDERERARGERERRLQRLEEQCQLLVRKVDITTHKSNFLCNRLEELHEQYGERQEEGESVVGHEGAASHSNANHPEASQILPLVNNGSESEEPKILNCNTVPEITSEHNQTDAQTNERLVSQDLAINHTSISDGNMREDSLHTRLCSLQDQTPHETEPIVSTNSNTNEQSPKSSDKFQIVEADVGLNLPESPPGNSVVSNTNCLPPTENHTEESSTDILASSSRSTEQSVTAERDTSLGTLDARMAARAEKLKRLEEQCSSLFGKVSNTVQRGSDLSARLQEIHEGCVSAEARLESPPRLTECNISTGLQIPTASDGALSTTEEPLSRLDETNRVNNIEIPAIGDGATEEPLSRLDESNTLADHKIPTVGDGTSSITDKSLPRLDESNRVTNIQIPSVGDGALSTTNESLPRLDESSRLSNIEIQTVGDGASSTTEEQLSRLDESNTLADHKILTVGDGTSPITDKSLPRLDEPNRVTNIQIPSVGDGASSTTEEQLSRLDESNRLTNNEIPSVGVGASSTTEESLPRLAESNRLTNLEMPTIGDGTSSTTEEPLSRLDESNTLADHKIPTVGDDASSTTGD